MKITLLSLLIFNVLFLSGQDLTKSDTTGAAQAFTQELNYQDSVLTEKEFMNWVGQYHPISQQADLMEEQGNMLVRSGRGGFDPTLFYDFVDKDFKEKNYYDLAQVGLKIPTWYGVEFKTGWDYAYGNYTNPMDNTPDKGLGYVGVGVNLGKGLLMDKRRAQLLKAKQYQQMNINERNSLLNDLYRDAIYQYWEWSAAYKKKELLTSTLENATDRFQGLLTLAKYGELSALDTLEAFTQIQAVQTEVFEAEAKFLQETFELNNFLWGENLEPLNIDGLYPEELMVKINSDDFYVQIDTAKSLIDSHPVLMSYSNKLQTLVVEKRLKAEYLKPKIKLQYNLLTDNFQLNPGEYTTNNYKWGINVSMPIFLRKERGDLSLMKIKIEQQQYENRLKQQEILAKIKTYEAKTEALFKQGKSYQRAVEGYEALLRQEELKLQQGSSSLFKLTVREIKMFRANLKLVDLHLKLVQSATAYTHSGGQLYSFF